MTDSRLQTILTVLPVLSAGLYLMGVADHQGYLDAFGVDDLLFPLAFDKALLSGFLFLATVSLVPMFKTISAALVLAGAVMVAAGLASHPRVKHWQSIVLAKLHKWRATNATSEAMNDFGDKSATIFGYFIVYSIGVLTVVILLILVTVLSFNSGRARAVRAIRSFNDQAGNYAILHSPLLPAPTRSRQIICGQSHCAFWLGSETLVLRHESIERMVMHNPAVEGALRDKAAQRPSP